ncbi:DUF4387 domain-containing protein [Kribbella sandramycini]|uniref:DUF4387 domain-containing protein n=1 Tax=Kribbella sandramycini TaxID=60450 RepID=A0A841SHM4_9ACTN|nr:hypothetical protein [Kribbella sandramycini]
MTTLADLTTEVRSKNAGPFWLTLELFLRDEPAYQLAADPRLLNERTIAALYAVDETTVQLFRIPTLNVIKISFPRPRSQGSLHDRDMHSGQQHIPLAQLQVQQPPA